ncbi:MAG: LysM peptidoglycan-binding domain-containing protein [Chloroflexota bacterium]|nr:LysM peptidoglycan-binding domain-containing protein [Chloroflexota bacterium]
MRRILVMVVLALVGAVFAVPASASDYVNYVVDRGDTLAGIARHYGVTVHDLLAANPSIVNPNRIWAGMILYIPTGSYQPPYNPGYPQDPGVCAYYVVRYGDTLSGIASWYGLNAWDIAYYNGIYNLNHIYAGMYLKIPCDGTYVPQPHYPQPQPPYYPHIIHYTVLPGDNLTSIAYRYGTTIQDILTLNPLEIPYGNYLRRGIVIQVPVGPNAPGY